MVPGSCEAYGDVRLLPGMTAEEVKTLIKEQLEQLAITSYRLDDMLFVPAAETDPQTEIVQSLATAVEMITGVQPRLEGSGPACDGWMFMSRGIPTVCGYGVACGGVHGADEWVDLASLRCVNGSVCTHHFAFLWGCTFVAKMHALKHSNPTYIHTHNLRSIPVCFVLIKFQQCRNTLPLYELDW